MYISLSQPAIPEYKALIKLRPVEPMKITHYKKESSNLVAYIILVWLIAAIISGITSLTW